MEVQQLEYAVNVAYDPAVEARTPPENRQALRFQALEFIEGVRRSADGWRLALALFRSAGVSQQAKFFALSTLQSCLDRTFKSGEGPGLATTPPPIAPMPPEARLEVRLGLLAFIAEREMGQEESFIRTKLAVVLALCIKNDYPDQWPSAWVDLQQLVDHGNANTELWLRILAAVDEEIVSFHVDRQPGEVARNTAVKDAMRCHVDAEGRSAVAHLCGGLFQVARAHGAVGPHLASLALSTYQRFMGWIDHSLVLSDQVLDLLAASAALDSEMAEAALGCALEMATKGLSRDETKVTVAASLLRLLSPVADRFVDDREVSEAAAMVLVAVGSHLLDVWDEEGAAPQAAGAAAAPCAAPCAALLASPTLPLLLGWLGHWAVEVSSTALPLAMRLLDSAKKQLDLAQQLSQGHHQVGSPGHSVSFEPAGWVVSGPLLGVVVGQVQYSPGFAGSSGGGGGESDELSAEADEETHRRAARKLWCKCVRVCPKVSLEAAARALAQALQAGMAGPGLPWQRAEATLRLVFHFGEGLGPGPELDALLADPHEGGDQTEAQGCSFGAMLSALIRSDCFRHPHWAVGLLYLEIVDRYWKHLRQNGAELIGLVLEQFCGPTGLTHPNPTLRARACYLLKSLVRHLGPGLMAPFAPNLLTGVRELAFESGGFVLAASDKAQLLELASMLLSLCSSCMPAEAQAAHLDALVAPLLAQLASALSASQRFDRAAGAPEMGPACAACPGEELASILVLLSSASKGSSKPLPHLQPCFRLILQAATAALAARPGHPTLRSKFMVVVHRMVSVLEPSSLLPALPEVLSTLVGHLAPRADPRAQHAGTPSIIAGAGAFWMDSDEASKDLDGLVPLLNQLMIRFRSQLAPALDPVMTPLLSRVLGLAAEAVAQGGSGLASVQASVRGLERHYLQLVNHASGHDLACVLLSPANLPHLDTVLATTGHALANPDSDPALKRMCVGALQGLARGVANEARLPRNGRAEVLPVLDYLCTKMAPDAVAALLDASFKPLTKDAIGARLVGDVARFLAELAALEASISQATRQPGCELKLRAALLAALPPDPLAGALAESLAAGSPQQPSPQGGPSSGGPSSSGELPSNEVVRAVEKHLGLLVQAVHDQRSPANR